MTYGRGSRVTEGEAAFEGPYRTGEGHDLRFERGARESTRADANVHGKQHDSRSGLTVYYRHKPRNITTCCAENGIEKPRIHISVFERINNRSGDYAPANVPTVCEVVPRRDDDPEHVEDIQKSLDAASERMLDQMPELRRLVRSRRLLYYAILVTSLVGAAAWYSLMPATSEKAEDSSLLTGVKEGVTFLLPDFLARVVDPLFEYWPIAVPILIVLCGLFYQQHKLKDRARSIGLQIWRSVFPY